jgi:hypothetical protein
MRCVTLRSVLKCGHDGMVQNRASQTFVTISQVPVLVSDDPVGRSIVACPNYGLNVKPCTTTRSVRTGYSAFVTVAGHAVCLDVLEGVTDGVDAQVVTYTVRDPRETFVDVAS